MKKCTKCLRRQSADNFQKRTKNTDGLDHYCKPCRRKQKRDQNTRFYYGDVERPDVCDLCGGPPGTRSLHYDHDHATGLFRGWLCHNCNMGLGHFKDSPDLLRKAADYLVR